MGTVRAGSIKQDFCGYIHLCTCEPGGVAPVESSFAANLLEAFDSFAATNSSGYIRVPSDLTKIDCGHMMSTGGSDYLLPYKA